MKSSLVQFGCKGPLKQQDLLVRKKTAYDKIFGAPVSDSSTPPASTSAPTIAVVSKLSSYLDSDIITCFDDYF